MCLNLMKTRLSCRRSVAGTRIPVKNANNSAAYRAKLVYQICEETSINLGKIVNDAMLKMAKECDTKFHIPHDFLIMRLLQDQGYIAAPKHERRAAIRSMDEMTYEELGENMTNKEILELKGLKLINFKNDKALYCTQDL
ncbi:unnamed protein product [Cochlearia groenlandica]